MPATEQTWRSQKGMHVIFAISGIALLASTIWMFQADHDRQWKRFQKTARRIELTGTKWRTLQDSFDRLDSDYQETKDKLEQEDTKSFAETAEALVNFWETDNAIGPDPSTESKPTTGDYFPSEKADVVAGSRAGQLEILNEVIADVRNEENNKLQERKFESAKFDARRANLSLGVRDGVGHEVLEQRQRLVDLQKRKVDDLQGVYDALRRQRQSLQESLNELTAERDRLQAHLDELTASAEQLDKASVEQRSTFFTSGFPFLGKRWLELPILDAFNSPLKIDNLWSDGLMHRYGSFSQVRRFDRCTTCHQAIHMTAAGTSDQPAYPHQRRVVLELRPPPEPEPAAAAPQSGAPEEASEEASEEDQVRKLYGVMLAAEGLLDPTDVTVKLVGGGSLAAQASVSLSARAFQKQSADDIRENLLKPVDVSLSTSGTDAGLRTGDVIELINGRPIRDRKRAVSRLLDAAAAREVLRVTVRRGLPHPYASHPRLDLFVGSLSPHTLEDFACTVCHDGQGGATDFKWVSHTPNDERQRLDWRRKYGWFDNHHWITPAYPKRLVQATCLKCHHDVQSLAPSQKFPDPPAPKLMHGHKLIQKYGCFGCHEIKGFDGPDRRVGPDLRLEPNYFAAAQQWKGERKAGFDKLNSTEQDWVEQLIAHPERDGVRHRLHQLIVEDKNKHDQDGGSRWDGEQAEYVHNKLEPLLRDVETPGTQRKVGPSLRFVGNKVDAEFMYDWIRQPQHFRPTSRMPQFFGLWNHLENQVLEREDHALASELDQLKKQRKPRGSRGRQIERRISEIKERRGELKDLLDELKEQVDAKQVEKRYEPIEILGIVTYLRHYSQQFAYLDPPELTPSDTATAEEQIERGRLLFQERGCLACHTHTAFRGAEDFRDPDAIGQGPDLSRVGDKFASPASRRWLYSWIKNPSRYHARTVMPDLKLEPVDHRDAGGKLTHRSDPVANLVDFLLSEKSKANFQVKEDTLALGADGELPTELQGDVKDLATEFLGGAFDKATANTYAQDGIPAALRNSQKGAEALLVVDGDKPVDWQQKLRYIGSKSISKYGCYACHDIPGFEDAKPIGTPLADWGRKETSKLAFEHITHYVDHTDGHNHGHGATTDEGSHAADEGSPAVDDGLDDFFQFKLQSHHREGFIYQKLREPRSYDYEATANKGYSERLRMPQFPFGHAEREAVITFVLGLVADPPSAKYVYQADARTQALIDGRHALDKYNCGGCHLLETQQWQLSFEKGTFGQPATTPTFPFLAHQLDSQTREKSQTANSSGRLTAKISAMPLLFDGDGKPRVDELEDGEAFPLEDEETYAAGKFTVSPPALAARRPGGKLLRRRYASAG